MSTLSALSPVPSYFILSLGGHGCVYLPNSKVSRVLLMKSLGSHPEGFIGTCTEMLNNHRQAVGKSFRSSRGCVIPDVINVAVSHTKQTLLWSGLQLAKTWW